MGLIRRVGGFGMFKLTGPSRYEMTRGVVGLVGTTGTVRNKGSSGFFGPAVVMIIFWHLVKSLDGLKLHLPFFFLQTLYLKYTLNGVFLFP